MSETPGDGVDPLRDQREQVRDYVEDEAELSCPWCGSSTLDGHGSHTRRADGRALGYDWYRRDEKWEHYHCPDCDRVFATREISAEKHYEEVDPDE